MHRFRYREIFTAGIGSILEYYDFLIFGFFAPVFSPLFFPANSDFLSILWGYSAFAIGFVFRPLGGIVFGHIGDRLGRKTALSSSIIFMGMGTLLIGLLPEYDKIGILAPLLLILARVTQGFSIGGEYTGGVVFAVEHSSRNNKKGLATSIIAASAMSGVLLASLASYIVNLVPYFSWRHPFILGFIVSIIGLYARIRTLETEDFKKVKEEKQILRFPIVQGIKQYYNLILYVALIGWFVVSAFLIHWIILPPYLKKHLPISNNIIDLSVTIGILITILTSLLFGYLSDYTQDRTKFVKVVFIILPIFVLFMYLNLQSLNVFSFIICQIVFSFLYGIFVAPLRCYIAETFDDIKVRYSSYSFANGAGEILGGITPLIATTLLSLYNGSILLGYFVFATGMVALFSIYKTKPKNKILS